MKDVIEQLKRMSPFERKIGRAIMVCALPIVMFGAFFYELGVGIAQSFKYAYLEVRIVISDFREAWKATK